MTIGKNNKILTSFAIIYLISAFFFSLSAQSTSKVTDDLVIKLQQKVLLTQQQTDEIKKSLNNYFTDPSEANRSSLESKIESLLEEKQKMKYKIIKADWWKSVSEALNTVKTKSE
jgi:hypothetical protein